jgi:hypothetical protein
VICACGKTLCSRNRSGMCRACVGRSMIKAKVDRHCSVCGVVIYRYSLSGYCRRHAIAERLNNPETQAKRTEGVRRYAAANIHRLRVQLRANQDRALAEHPTYREFLRQRAKVIQPLGVAASHTPEVLARRSRKHEPKQSRTFEETLALVAAGKLNISTKLDLRAPDPSGTLGGVSTGWMG